MWDDLGGWISDNLWAVWAIVAVLLAAAEVVSLDFVLIMLAVRRSPSMPASGEVLIPTVIDRLGSST